MPAGSTYTPIATTTLGSSAASYTFTSIPSTYTDLYLVCAGSMATVSALAVRVGNGSIDSGTNYSDTALYGSGSAAATNRSTNATAAFFDGWVNTVDRFQANINFQSYAGSTNKTFLMRGTAPATELTAVASLWRSTAVINTIQVLASTGSFASGTTFTLYGIAAA